MKRMVMRRVQNEYGLYLAFVILIIAASVLSPAFLRWQNITNIMAQTAPLMVVALGQFFVIVVGGLDLSQASVMATAAVIVAQVTQGDNSLLPLALLLVVLFALAVGLGNGWVVTKRHVPPFIATLGSMLIVQGFRFLLTAGAPKGLLPSVLVWLGRGRSFVSIPVSAWLVILLIAVVFIVTRHTAYGYKLYGTGGGPTAAELAGIKTDMVVTAAYVLSCLLAAVGGMLLSGFAGMVDNWVGKGYELDAIAAVVLGGVALEGGRGGVGGVVIGVLIMQLLFNFVFILHLSVEFQEIIKGLVLIGAGALYARRLGA